MCKYILGLRIDKLASTCEKPKSSASYGAKNLAKIRSGKLPINKAEWPIHAKHKMDPISESATKTTTTPESVMLATGGGTIHDMLRAQRSDYKASVESQRLAPIVTT